MLADVAADSAVMAEEIFGPILPVVVADGLDEAIAFINDRDKPLALYAFTESQTVRDRLVAETSSGGVGFGLPVAHLTVSDLPFGGVGDSGFGRIHGDEGIREFTRTKATAEQVMSIPLNMMSFRQPKDMPSRIRGMIRQLYGDGVVARATDLWRRFRT